MIRSFVSEIVGVVFLSAACEMLMPEGTMKKYVRLAIGFVMIAVFMSPFTKEAEAPRLSFDFGSAYSEEELRAQSDAYVLEFHRKNIEERAVEICGEGSSAHAEVYSDGQVKSVTITADRDMGDKLPKLKEEFGCENIVIVGGGNEN